ncbi:unnamed protein product [Phytomonas sp. Hart1]|nr:unnamed protein product [Phytomonas sp. Hart1]|eukprot:CCW72177.1 unnamed protein product [Phytomonas sp. isolate Hart1]
MIFHTNNNMMRLPNAVRRFLLEAAALPGSHADLDSPGEGAEIPRGGGNETAASLCDMRNAAAGMLELIQRAKSDFVFDAQGEDHHLAAPADPLPEWQPYTALLRLLDPHHPQRAYAVDSLARLGSTSKGVGSNDGCGGGRLTAAKSTPLNMLSCDEWDFIFNQHLQETSLCREILEYSIYLRKRYGPNVRLCTDSLTLAAYSMAFGLQVVSVGFLASPFSNGHLES